LEVYNIMTQGQSLIHDHAVAWTSLTIVVFKVLASHHSPDVTTQTRQNNDQTVCMLMHVPPIMNDERKLLLEATQFQQTI
jgi:hypothetical protein